MLKYFTKMCVLLQTADEFARLKLVPSLDGGLFQLRGDKIEVCSYPFSKLTRTSKDGINN